MSHTSYEDRKSSAVERRTMMQQKRKLLEQRRTTMGLVIPATFSWTPSGEPRRTLTNLRNRHQQDTFHIDTLFTEEFDNWVPQSQTVFDDDRDPYFEPTYAKFRIPLEIRCLERYQKAKKRQAKQFKRELNMLIENMPNADCAWQFVRTMSYTTLWPPLHTREELARFNTFFKLTPQEEARYLKIMSTNLT